ncbi:HD domain-containing protein [Arthrobacter cryoconiti]|uniref:HD domain-containing protein n=1 Tax=Arthrobacter cryoconiti TaxID=748907 RepID=A0ABV8R5K1_9MICC|nr:HD domain-containing protein [Arthrobacter cryoconiti]MCC9069327.1 HD domain-containing protein [Arthrobacter cryoconiti]
METASEVIAKAAEVATAAHAGQVDKSGADYIGHPARVASNVRRLFPDAPDEAVAVAWLHDVAEDTEVGCAQLLEMGFTADVVAGVDAMTKRQAEPVEEYFSRVRANLLARMVKAADLKDNTDPARVAMLDQVTAQRLRVKYDNAYRLLGEA